jgi:hypothetical protein
MFRFFLFVIGVVAVGASMAEEATPCPDNTLAIRVVVPDFGSPVPRHSVIRIPSDPVASTHPSNSDYEGMYAFSVFRNTVTEHIAAQLAKEKLCVTGAESTESMDIAVSEHRSLIQFVYWHLSIYGDYIVPVMTVKGGASGCGISSPWIDLTFVRAPVPSIHGVVRFSDRQLLADQAVLAGARNVPTGVAMPLSTFEFIQFIREYEATEFSPPRKSAAKPIEERVPPDILWLLRHSRQIVTQGNFGGGDMHIVRKKGAEGYTKLVLALIDRCFATNEESLRYNSILDVDDPVLLEQYKIDMPIY